MQIIKGSFGINPEQLPKHIAIIMDGNGRWAKNKLLPRFMGHRAGMETLKKIVRCCSDNGIKVLTVYAFSTENWKRPKDEIGYLMDLLIEYLNREIEELHQNSVKLCFIGDISGLPGKCQKAISEALKKTSKNDGMILNIAMNYGGRADIVRAARILAENVLEGKIKTKDISEEQFSKQLYTKDEPDPDLLIRTAGDLRISNFLLWQIAYSELYFTNSSWPEFTTDQLTEIIQSYALRDRRFGGLKQ